MAEYIEKQAAKEKLCSMCRWEGTSNCDECEHPIDDIPPADVRSVDVGLWLRVGNTGLASCRCGFITDRYSTYRYCPNCGSYNGGDAE